jgi:hypothetical protein
MRSFTSLTLLSVIIPANPVHADFVLFSGIKFISESGKKIPAIIEGKINTNTGSAMLLVNHPAYGSFYLPKNECKVLKSENLVDKHRAELKKAAKQGELETLWNLARESVQYGIPANYFRAAELVLEKNPNHEEAKRAIRLMNEIDRELPESKDEETDHLKQSQITPPPGATFARSAHFLVLHDTKPTKIKAGKKILPPLIDQRLEALEQVYNSYFAFFWSRGYELPLPKRRLYVVLFSQERDFRQAARAIGIESASAVGFYSLERDVSYFFEFRGTPQFREAKKDVEDLRSIGKNKNVANRGDFNRLASALDVLMEDKCEKEDISVISHEAVHHLCAASGLMPNGHGTPNWAAEGIGTYFEASKATGWTGIGAVSDERLAFYRASSPAVRSKGGIEFVVSNDIFDLAKGDGGIFAAYGHSWAFTHFLMEKHFDRLMKYYKRFADGPKVGFVRLKRDVYLKHFDACFPRSERKELQAQFDRYMSNIKSDLEKTGSNISLFDLN